MPTLSAALETEIKAFLSNWWNAVHLQIAAATGNTIQLGEDAPLDQLYHSEIGQRLARIASIAEEQPAWSPGAAQATLADCDAFEAWLNPSPAAARTPETFWNTTIGYLVLQARLWAEQDRLVSLKEAAALSRLSLSSLSQRISRGQMQCYRDPRQPNPQRARRIRLAELEQFIHQGIVRKPAFTLPPKVALAAQTPIQTSLGGSS